MKAIESTRNHFGGVLPKPEALPVNPDRFRVVLAESLKIWKAEKYRVVWLEVPIEKSSLIPVAVEVGFSFHHSGNDYLMATFQLEEGAFIPAHSSHYIGAGGVTLNENGELLVVSERYHRTRSTTPRYKLPGGALRQGEHLAEAGGARSFRRDGSAYALRCADLLSALAWIPIRQVRHLLRMPLTSPQSGDIDSGRGDRRKSLDAGNRLHGGGECKRI